MPQSRLAEHRSREVCEFLLYCREVRFIDADGPKALLNVVRALLALVEEYQLNVI